MTNKNFDDKMRELMQDHNVEYDPLSWFPLENQLNDVLGDDQVMEENIQEKLHNHQVQYKPSTWSILKRKLDLQDELKRKIYYTKLAEATILLLLFLSIIHLNPFQRGENMEKPVISSPAELSAPVAKTPQTMQDNLITSNHQQQNVTIRNQMAHASQAGSSSEITSNIQSSSQRNTPVTGTDIQRQFEIPAVFALTPAISEVHSPVAGQIPEMSLSSLIASNQKVQEFNPPAFQARNEIGNLAKLSQHIPHLAHNLNYLNNRSIEPLSKNKIQHIGVFTSLDLNVINRPLDLKIFQQPEQYGAFGPTIGILYGSRKGHHDFEFGLAYSKKTYDPNLREQVNVHSSYYERDFEKMSFEILQVPFNYKLHSPTKRGWNIFALVGADINVVAFTEYHFNNILKSGQPRPTNAIEKNSKLTRTRDFHDGLFQGGTVFKNVYLTGTIGFGLEKQFRNHSIYIQPVYKHHLFTQQLGPNNEKLNALSVQIGTNFDLD